MQLVISWNQHVDKLTAKANMVLGLVNRTCMDLKDTDSIRTLNVTVINWRLFSEELPDESLDLILILD